MAPSPEKVARRMKHPSTAQQQKQESREIQLCSFTGAIIIPAMGVALRKGKVAVKDSCSALPFLFNLVRFGTMCAQENCL